MGKSLRKCKECGHEFVVESDWREGDEERALEHFGPIPICPECGHKRTESRTVIPKLAALGVTPMDGSELLDANHQGPDDADG